jgi:hypothetical protein
MCVQPLCHVSAALMGLLGAGLLLRPLISSVLRKRAHAAACDDCCSVPAWIDWRG